MRDQEFDNYLGLVGRLLRLNSRQRSAIGHELRDHLETRLEELTAQDVPHDEAVRTALEEFGDAAGLAHTFTSLARHQQRRALMRYSFGTVVVAAAVALLVSAMMPASPQGLNPGFVSAQQQDKPRATAVNKDKADRPKPDTPLAVITPPMSEQSKATANKLVAPIAARFDNVALKDVLGFVRDAADVDIHVKWHVLEQSGGFEGDHPVSLALNRAPASLVLELVLESAEAAYTIRDGIVIVSHKSDPTLRRLEMRVYPVADLLKAVAPFVGPQTRAAGRQPGNPFGTSELGGRATRVAPSPTSHQAEHLIHLITETVQPETWSAMGGDGTAVPFGAHLVIKAQPATHREVEQFITMLRQATAQSAAASKIGR